jgi:hypothetical protein
MAETMQTPPEIAAKNRHAIKSDGSQSSVQWEFILITKRPPEIMAKKEVAIAVHSKSLLIVSSLS